jgi:N6-L-threonylcarbamoyladenine synthase
MPQSVLGSIRYLGVTAGPGLPGCLLAGVNFTRGLAKSLGVELYGLNHLAGHVFSPFMPAADTEPLPMRFPHLALLVSGGHTELFLVRGLTELELLGQTHDDAVGELLDKISAVLGYGYPGGAQMEQLARSCPNMSSAGEYTGSLRLPVPMRESGDLNFSYSGLKTAAVRLVRGMAGTGAVEPAELASSLFSVVLESLWMKVRSAAEQYSIELVSVSGGVAINGFLRERFAAEASRMGIECLFPARQHCLDNAEMMAWLLKCYVEAAIAPVAFDARSSWNPGKKLTPVAA